MTRAVAAQIRIESHGAAVDALAAALDERGIPALVADLGPTPTHADFQGLRAVVLAFAAGRVPDVRERVRKLAGPVLDAGASLVVLADGSETSRIANFEKDSTLGLPLVFDEVRGRPVPTAWPKFLVESDIRAVANTLASAVPHGIPSTPVPSGLAPDVEKLLGRAFGDLVRIRVAPLATNQQGKTSKVLRVDGEDGRGHLLPFLVKVTKRSSAAFELDNYRRHVEDFVPFPVRPSLVPERCVFGSTNGLLAYRFIEHERALGDIVLEVASPATLHNVFEHLFAGWWHHGTTAQVAHHEHVLKGVRHWFDCEKSPRRRAALRKHANSEDGGKVASLVGRIDSLSPRSYKTGWIHGDLHAENIRVRGTDAFLIDFGSVDQGPLLADPAALEASLVLKAGQACVVAGKKGDWATHLTQRLYPEHWHEHVPARRDLSSDVPVLARLGDALRTIRLHAFSVQTSSGEYAQLVAAAFLRQASFESEPNEPQRTTCVSTLYSVADQIVASLA